MNASADWIVDAARTATTVATAELVIDETIFVLWIVSVLLRLFKRCSLLNRSESLRCRLFQWPCLLRTVLSS